MDWVQERGLIDLDFVGPRYTWITVLRWRIENQQGWIEPYAMLIGGGPSLKHLSNTSPMPIRIIVSSEEVLSFLGRRPIRFQAAWLEHKDFKKMVMKNWDSQQPLPAVINLLTENLITLNKEVFKNIFQRQKRVQLHLDGVQRALAREATPGLLKLEDRLNEEWNEILLQEELL